MSLSVRRFIANTAVLVTLAVPLASVSPASAIDTGANKDSVENYLGIDSTGLIRLQRRQEEAVATCMKKEGFSYFPESPEVPTDAVDGGANNRKGFVEKYGYGISTLINPPKKGTKTKNQTYLEKLSAADKRAYYVTLLGYDPSKSNGAGNDISSLNPKSCLAKVGKEVFGDLVKLQGLIAKYDDISKRVAANPNVVRAMRDWSACMKKSGYSYTKDGDVEPDLTGKLTKLYKAPPTPFGTPDNSSIDTPGLTALKKQELAIAKIDWDCSKKHLAERDRVKAELEKKFIAENQAGLNDFKKVLDKK